MWRGQRRSGSSSTSSAGKTADAEGEIPWASRHANSSFRSSSSLPVVGSIFDHKQLVYSIYNGNISDRSDELMFSL